ncbi:hypothetical protein GCM10023322_28320 [Rugosimonospora acidiphila]|uniref:PH domain-containing protein n=1 Tax=Rugosimonospora acidiphila TaxID=556531 RepID=A0ABP9RRN2_9ACTN
MTMRDGRPEVFRPAWAQTWQTVLRPWLVTDILILFVGGAVGYVIGGPVVSVVLPVAVVAALVALSRYRSWSQVVRLSEYGVELLRRNGGVTRMRWSDVERIAVVAQRGRSVLAPYGVGRAAAAGSMAAFVAANTGPGLLGRAEHLTRSEAERQRGQGPAWQPSGRELEPLAVRLVVIDRNWITGPIGDWVRLYRPDLLPPVPSPAPRG